MAATSIGFERAQAIAMHLANVHGVRAVAVFGSVARGTAQASSDIDLLVLVDDAAPPRQALMAAIPQALRIDHLGLRRYKSAALSHTLAVQTAFALHLRREARVLVDPLDELQTILLSEPEHHVSIGDQLALEVARLNVYDNLDIFRDDYLYLLTRVYTVAKSVAILGTCATGVPTFDRRSAFEVLGRAHPELDDDLRFLSQLEPFYLRLTRRVEAQLPFPYRGCRQEVLESMAAVRRIAAAIS